MGPNGSGKSNFADALVFARDVGIDAAGALERRGGIDAIRRWSPSKPYDIVVDVWASKSRRRLEQETDYVRHHLVIKAKKGTWRFAEETIQLVKAGKIEIELERKGERIVSAEPDAFPDDLNVRDTVSLMVFAKQVYNFGRAGLGQVRHIRLAPEVMRAPQSSRSESPIVEPDGRNIAMALRDLLSHRRLDNVLVAMRKIIPGLESIDVETLGRHLVVTFSQAQRKDKVAKFYASDMSEGALRALGIVVAAEQMKRDELLVLEEPEVNLHVGAARVLFDVLREAADRGAVLMTTHSADLLDAVRDEEILVCEYEDGETRIGPLAESQRKIVRDGLFSVAELMRSEPLRIASDDEE